MLNSFAFSLRGESSLSIMSGCLEIPQLFYQSFERLCPYLDTILMLRHAGPVAGGL